MEIDLSQENVFFLFHYRFDWMNWLDEHEAFSGIQSFGVWQSISQKIHSIP